MASLRSFVFQQACGNCHAQNTLGKLGTGQGSHPVACGDANIAEALLKSGIDVLADSRISNIRKMRDSGIQAQFVLLRTPFPSQIEEVVRYTDISLNSELSVIKALSKFALRQKSKHKIILMVDLLSLRIMGCLLDIIG